MSEAFEAALKELQDTGQRTVARDVIAGRIIAAGGGACWDARRTRLATPFLHAGAGRRLLRRGPARHSPTLTARRGLRVASAG